ncbi:MAG TPA: Hsp20/alpha crystallin family protein [Opitutaceae bacterium]|nr:Hsp20/alpha crystallin family protein [Opitutaceae bacterium]
MKTFVISLVTLVIGLSAGIAFMVYRDQSAEADHSAPSSSPPHPAPAFSGGPPATTQWNPFTEMRRMQQEMDRAFNDSVAQLRQQPPFNAFPDAPGYSLSLDVREFKDRFEVRAALPDAKASDVNVKLDNDRTLTVEVSNRHSSSGQSGSNSATSEEWGQYSQTIELPAAVQAAKMKTEHRGHELVIVLPKVA